MSEPILEIRDVKSGYGKIEALKGVSLSIHPGEIVCIIGANGAGKSTTLMTICGIVRATSGTVAYRGEDITHARSDTMPSRGLIQVPEGRRIFPRLSVKENLEMGAFYRKDQNNIKTDLDNVCEYFPILKERIKQPGGTLSGGEQQMLAIGRALMGRPKVLLLDEPSLGLAPLIVQRIFSIIEQINKSDGTTILLVEQNANIALHIASRGYVLETGNVVMADESNNLLENPDIRKAYLGE